MPKQPVRVHAAITITVQDLVNQMHPRKLVQVLQNARDNARLRGAGDQKTAVLRAQPHRDPLIRRIFSRDDIAQERLAVRAALARAADNMTPERLKKLGSPGRRAVRTLRTASAVGLDHDVRVRQVRSAITLLAGTRKARSFKNSPVKARTSWVAQTGATALVSGDCTRRAQLHKFCIDSAGSGILQALLMRANDNKTHIAASISIAKAAALNFIVEDMKGRKPEITAAQVRSRCDGLLLRLFITRWRQAVAEGKIGKGTWPWFDAVDWLVTALHGVRPTSPGATRAPKSPRIISPVAAARRRAQAAPAALSPVAVPKKQGPDLQGAKATPVKSSPLPRQLARQFQQANLPSSPTILSDGGRVQQTAPHATSQDGAQPERPVEPAEKVAPAVLFSPGGRLNPTFTLEDIIHCFVEQDAATSVISDRDSERGAHESSTSSTSITNEPLPDGGQ